MPIRYCKHKEGCTNYQAVGKDGYCHLHETESPMYEYYQKKKERQEREKKNRAEAKKISQKLRVTENPKNKNQTSVLQDKVELHNWFLERRKEMTGRCLFCGEKTSRDDDKYFKFSVAHLLAKRPSMFPSVAKHKDNWIELCYFQNSCHSNHDNSMITLEDVKNTMPKAWEVIVTKFKKIYPSIAENEKKNIPQILLNELN
jgi:hypothetical protein